MAEEIYYLIEEFTAVLQKFLIDVESICNSLFKELEKGDK